MCDLNGVALLLPQSAAAAHAATLLWRVGEGCSEGGALSNPARLSALPLPLLRMPQRITDEL